MPQADEEPMTNRGGNASPATPTTTSTDRIHARAHRSVTEDESMADDESTSKRLPSHFSPENDAAAAAQKRTSAFSSNISTATTTARVEHQQQKTAASTNAATCTTFPPHAQAPTAAGSNRASVHMSSPVGCGFPFTTTAFPWMAAQPFGSTFAAQQPFSADAAARLGRCSLDNLQTPVSEMDRQSADGLLGSMWRPGSGGYLPSPTLYPLPVHPMWYSAAAIAMRNMAIASANSRPNSPRSKKRALSISPGSDKSTVIDAIRHSPTSLFYSSSDFNSRSSSAASVNSFGHLSAGPVNHSLPHHFRGSPVLGPFQSAPFSLPMPPMPAHMNPNMGYPFVNPVMANFPTAGFYPMNFAFANANNVNVCTKQDTVEKKHTVEQAPTQPAPTKPVAVVVAPKSRESTYSSSDVDVEDDRPARPIKEEPPDGFAETNCHWTDCTARYDTQMELVKHVANCHIEGSKSYVCRWGTCGREKAFKAKYMLVVHMRRHTGEKPHQCTMEGCGKAYSRLENLKTHLRSHTGDKPYLCDFVGCGKSFTNASDRAKHQSRTHSDEKRYACRVAGCSNRYTDPSSLRKHVKTKHGAEAFANKKHKGSESQNNENDLKGQTNVVQFADSTTANIDSGTEPVSSENPGSNQSGSVDSPATTFSNNTDELSASLSPRYTDSGIEMNAGSDCGYSLAHDAGISDCVDHERAAIPAVLAAGDDDCNEVFDPNYFHNGNQRRLAAKQSLATVYGDPATRRIDRIAEYVAEQSFRHTNNGQLRQWQRPASTYYGSQRLLDAVTPRSTISTSAPTVPIANETTLVIEAPAILAASASCQLDCSASTISSDFSSVHSVSETTSYPASVLSSRCVSRSDSVMSFGPSASVVVPNNENFTRKDYVDAPPMQQFSSANDVCYCNACCSRTRPAIETCPTSPIASVSAGAYQNSHFPPRCFNSKCNCATDMQVPPPPCYSKPPCPKGAQPSFMDEVQCPSSSTNYNQGANPPLADAEMLHRMCEYANRMRKDDSPRATPQLQTCHHHNCNKVTDHRFFQPNLHQSNYTGNSLFHPSFQRMDYCQQKAPYGYDGSYDYTPNLGCKDGREFSSNQRNMYAGYEQSPRNFYAQCPNYRCDSVQNANSSFSRPPSTMPAIREHQSWPIQYEERCPGREQPVQHCRHQVQNHGNHQQFVQENSELNFGSLTLDCKSARKDTSNLCRGANAPAMRSSVYDCENLVVKDMGSNLASFVHENQMYLNGRQV